MSENNEKKGKVSGIFQKAAVVFSKKIIKGKTLKIILGCIIPVIILILLKNFCFYQIPPGQKGCLFNKLRGGTSGKVMDEGIHFIFPGFQSVYYVNTARQRASVERITADSSEFQDVALWLNVEFRIKDENIPDLFNTFGIKSSQEIIDEFIIPNTNEVTKNIIINYRIGDILPNQPAIKAKITEDLGSVLGEYYIEIVDVDIENIRLAPEFRDIVAEIEFADYERQREDLRLEVSRKEAERRILEGETRKREKILQAEAEAEYNNLLSRQNLSESILEYKKLENQRMAIDKWNGQFPSQVGDIPVNGLF